MYNIAVTTKHKTPIELEMETEISNKERENSHVQQETPRTTALLSLQKKLLISD
jgi:hypothetical protein